MRTLTGLLLVAAFSAPALAWVPQLDSTTAKTVIDSAYNRATNPLPTLETIDLTVKDGQFVGDGTTPLTVFTSTSTSQDSSNTTTTTTQTTVQAQPKNSITAIDGGQQCIADWLADPTDYSQGSRPQSITLTGQADGLFLKAQQARDAFKNLSVKDALAADPNALPNGNLKIYIQMAGLTSQTLRDAYNVAIRTPDGKITQPYKRAYTNDWKQESSGKWGGTMVYYFDALKAGATPSGKLDILIQTEADSNCAYSVTADLSKFN